MGGVETTLATMDEALDVATAAPAAVSESAVDGAVDAVAVAGSAFDATVRMEPPDVGRVLADADPRDRKMRKIAPTVPRAIRIAQ